MKYSNTVEYNISTKLDSSGLQKLKTELQQVELTLQKMGNEKLLDGSFSEAREQIQSLGDALTKAFNPSLGVLDLSTFKTELKESGVTMQGLKNAFTQAGSEGQIAFNNLIGQLGQLDTGIQRSNSQIDKLFTTFSNTFRWGLVSSFFSQFMNAIHNSVDYVKELDDSLTQIMLVTDYNRDSMNQYAKSANEAAKALSMSTTGMTNASLVFAQQGYDLNQSQELATLSAKLANASQQDTATTSDQITAYMNAYGLESSIEELTQQMDNWALIANVSAADVGELAQASQRAASMANAVGVSGEQLAAQIATIESVTREAPEQIGNGLKTLYARFSDIAAGGEDEDGFGLGKVTAELEKIGVQVLNEMGQIRDVGDIMEDLMVIWDDLDQTSKVAASQALAGKYQVNRFMALMDNSDMYQEYKGATGSAATGTLDQMNQEYVESLAGRTQKLNTTLEGLFNDVFTTDMVYPLIDALTKLADAVDTLFKSVGGGPTIILGLASAFTRLFSNNIAEQINNAAMNKAVQQQRIENSQNRGALLEQLKVANPDESNQNTQAIINYAQRINELAPNLSSEQWEQANQILKEMVQNANAATQAQGELKTQLEAVGTVIGSVFGDKFKAPFLDDAGGINATALIEDLKTTNLADSKESIKETKEELLTFNQGLQQFQEELNKTEAADRDFNNAIDFMSQSLVRLKDYMEPGLYNRLNTVFDNLSESVTNGDYSIEEITTTIKQFEGETGRVIEFLDKLSNKELSTQEIENFIKKLEELAFKTKNTEGAASGSNKLGASYLEAAEKQLNIKDVVDMIANIGQLSFAWQSFQNLGSLWQKTDISTGEKIQQTIANLTASLPMLYTSWKKITEILKIPSFKDSTSNIQQAKDAITNAQNQIAQAQEKIDKANNKAQGGFKALSTTLHNTGNGAAGFAKKASNGMHEVAQAADEMNKAQKDAATATAELRQAQLSLIGSLAFAAITVGLAIASAAWGAYQQKVQNAMATEKEALEKAKNTANETSSAVQEWQKLYDEYLETGEASDALIDSSEQLSEKLGILGGDAYAAAGNFEKLAEEIQKAADADAQNAIKEAKRLLDGTYGKSLNGDIPFNGSAQEDYSKALRDSTFDPIAQMLTGSGVTDASAQLRDWIYEAELMPQAADTVADSIGKAHQALNLLEEKQDEVQEKLKTDSTNQSYIDLNEQLTKAHQNLSEFLNIEDIKAAEEAYQTIAENTLRLSDTQKTLNGLAENGTSGTALLNYIGQLDGVSDYFKTLETNADKARFAISLLEDGAASAAIELDSLFDKDNDTFDNFSDKDKDSIKTSLNKSGLTPEEQLKVAVSIDEEQSLAEIQAFIEQIAEKVKNGTEISDAISQVLSEGIQSTEDVKAAIAEMEPRDTDLEVGPYREMAEYLREFAGELEGIPEQVGQNSEMLQNFTEAILRYDNAIQDADENLSDWKDLLLNTGEAAEDDAVYLEDLMEAFEGMRDMIGDLLDMDVSDLSQQFMQNSDVLDLLDEAIYGVGEEADLAYDKLDYLAQLDMAGLIDWTDGIEDELAAWDNALPSLEANMDSLSATAIDLGDNASYAMGIVQDVLSGEIPGPDINLDNFIAGLEQMVNSGEMSVAQAMAAIDGAGYSAEVTQGESEGTNVESHIDATPEQTEGVTVDSQIVGTVSSNATGPAALKDALGGSGSTTVSWKGNVPGIKWNMTPAEESTDVKANATGVKYSATTGGGSGAGQIHFKNVTAKPSGSTKRNLSGSGNHSRPSSGGGGSCFVAGTKISTYFGLKNIEDIQKNDIVLSYNEETQQNEYSIVLQTMIHNVVEPIYTLYIKNEQLRVTGIHRFLVKRNNLEWIPAQDIKIGDWILFADGTWHLIWKIDINIEHQIVYNFEVSNNHNYYVGYNQILAHNKGGKGSCFVAGTLITTNSSFKPIEQIQKDDIVLSYNEKLGMNEYSKVLQTMIHNTIEPIYTLHIKDEKLRVTGIHRFFVTNKIINGIPQWIHAADLKVGDWVLFADGTWHVIHKIDIDIEYQTVYNFEVSHNHNYYVGRNQILAHNKGGKGGGGGGGGSAKTIKPKEKKEHEKNYYEEVDNQLKKNEKTLSKIEKENDRLTGDKARANYSKQIELLEKDVKLQEKKLKILTEQEKVDVEAGLKKADKELEDLLNQNGITWKIPDPVYDEDGIISNYEQISEAIDRAHNEMIDKYNAAAAAGNEELAKQIEEVITKIDKKGEDLLKKAKRMNAIQTEIEDITASIEDLKDSVEDIRIEVYKASQEALKDLKKLKEEEAEIDALFHDANPNSFIDRWTIDGTPFVELKKILQEINSIYNVSADDARAYYDTLISEKQKALETASEDEKKAIQSTIDFYMQQKGLLSDDDPALENGLLGMRQRNLEQLKKWMDNPSDPSNPFGDNIKALKEAYQEEYEATLEDAKEAQELGQKARDEYLNTMEDISDEMDRHIDKYDILLDQLENISDTYQLYYGEDNYDDILNIMNQQADVAEQKMQQLETAYNYWLYRYDEALKTGDETIIHDAEDRLKDVQSAYADAAKEAAEYFVAIYEKTIDSSIQKMTNKLWGGGPGQMDLEDQSTIWELQKDYMSNYKDDVEKSFEIDKLRSKYISLLNDAQGMSLQTQNKIRAQMQDQLDLLQNQATMSEYDVKLANAKLEILQKQIALEDAQRNKNKMQLRRDTQGNYRYVYTADQGDVQQAQDELNESKYDAYEMTKEQTIANNDRAISLYNDYMEKVAAISKKYQDDEAAREAALAALSDEYREIFKALREDYADTTNGMYDLLTWMIDNTTSNTTDAAMNMLDKLYDKNGEVKENTGIAWRDLATNITDNVLDEIEEATQEMLEDINISAKSLASTVAGPNGPLSKIGATANTLTGTLNKTTSATAQLGAATRELFGYLAADDGELARATNQMAEYEEKLKGALSETSKLGEALRVANENLKAKTEEALNYKLQIDRLLSGEDIIENGRIVTGEELRKRKEEEAARQAQQNDNWSPYSDAYGIWMHGDWGGGGYWYGNYAAANGTWKADQVLALFNSGYGYSWMDTGGYTGDWTENEGIKDAKSGKLAVLHKKELVLNATDTENILGAVSIIRQLSNTLQNNLGNLAAQSANQNNISGIYNPSTTEQRVEIQATFPNATDADDIRTALLRLSDKAFQYAHRTI